MQKNLTQDQKTIETPKAEPKRLFISANKNRKCQTSQGRRQIWSLSATSMTRDKSPAFKISKAKRFSNVEQDQIHNVKFLDIELRTTLDKGITFAKSKRRDNFMSKQKMNYPASTTYFPNESKTQLDFLNPQVDQKLALIGHQMKNYLFSNTKGPTIKKFSKPHILYLHHGRQMNYQPQVTKYNPGVGKYSITPDKTRSNSPSFTFRKILQRFNQHDHMYPGPGAYNTIMFKSHKSESINSKGTFENSNRIFLQNPNNHVPGPTDYFKL